jgi:hypothetical protein
MICSSSDCETLTIGPRTACGSFGMRKCSTSSSRWKLRPPSQGRTISESASPKPRRSATSRVCRETQMARLPKETWLAASRTVTAMPRWARPRATAMPTGPAPTTTTGSVGSAAVIDGNCAGWYV